MKRFTLALIIATAIGISVTACDPEETEGTAAPSSSVAASTYPLDAVETAAPVTTAPADDSESGNFADELYFSLLDSNGLEGTYNRQGAKELGLMVCGLLDEGYTLDETLTIMHMGNSQAGNPVTDDAVDTVFGAAVNVYCPQYVPEG